MTETNDHEALELLAAMRLEDGRPWGQVATDWQLADATAVLHPGDADPLLHWLGRPKGGSKTTDVAGLGMAWLMAQAAELDEGFVVASDKDQAARMLRRAAGLIKRTPGLDVRLEVQTHQVVNRTTEARLVALAADAAGAEGLVSPLVLVDELPQWGDTKVARDMWDAAYSSITKVPGMRFVVIGHAGISGSWQHRLFGLFSKSPIWRVNDVPGPLSWVDSAVLEDQRLTLLPSQFSRRHLNEWGDGEDRLATVEALRACVSLDGPLAPSAGVEYVVAVDLGLKKDRTVMVVAHLEEIGGAELGPEARARAAHSGMPGALEAVPVRVVLDRIHVMQGSKRVPVQIQDVESWLLQASASFNKAPIVMDPWQMVGSAQRLVARGLEVEEFHFGAQSVGRLGATLHGLVRDGALALPDDEDLLDELIHVKLVEKTPGVVRLDHASGRHDDRAIALALAAHHLLNRPPPQRGWVVGRSAPPLTGTR